MAGSYQMNVETPATLNAQMEPLRVVEAVSPTATVEENEDGALITIHDLHGTTTAQVNNGATGPQGERGEQGPQGIQGIQGERGEKGAQGEKGDKGDKGDTGDPGPKGDTGAQGIQGPKGDKGDKGDTGEQGVQGIQGLKGDTGEQGPKGDTGATGPAGTDGISPTISVTDITGGHRVTITDATGAHSFDVMNGDAADAPVQDVQVNGTSVLSNGVANVPVAGMGTGLGLVKLAAGNGIGFSGAGNLIIATAIGGAVKNGTNSYTPLTPSNQHAASFYGLAKAAGDTTQSASSNAVGTYTDAAKIAIQKMLGCYEAPFRLIKTYTVSDDTTGIIFINKDEDGNDFELKEVVINVNLTACSGASNMLVFVNTEGGNPSDIDAHPGIGISGAIRNISSTISTAHFQVVGGKFFGTGASQISSASAPRNIVITQQSSGILDCGLISDIYIRSANLHIFGRNSVITIYGR